VRHTIEETTAAIYRRNLMLHVIPALGSMRLSALTGSILNRQYGRLLSDGRRDGKGGLSAATVIQTHNVLHHALTDAEMAGRISRNPAAIARPPKNVRSRERNTWRPEVFGDFIRTAEERGEHWATAWLLIGTTGCRRAEGLGLRWTDVDFDNTRIRIEQTITTADHVVVIKGPKNDRVRWVSLDMRTLDALKRWKAKQNADRLAIGPGWEDSGLVFTTKTGSAVNPEAFSKVFERRVKAWGFPKLSLHGLRHTWATLALEANLNAKVVQERLGHSKVSVTLDSYTHVSPKVHDDSAEKMAQPSCSGTRR
jgi:integrase